MPPVDSPSEPHRTAASARESRSTTTTVTTILPQLHDLDTPVADLASTLTTQAADAGPDFLPPHSPLLAFTASSSAASRRMRAAVGSSRESVRLASRRRLVREAIAQQQDRHRLEANVDSGLPPSTTSYGDRVPQRQSLYDWAPSNEGRDEGVDDEVWSFDDLLPTAEDLRDLAQARTAAVERPPSPLGDEGWSFDDLLPPERRRLIQSRTADERPPRRGVSSNGSSSSTPGPSRLFSTLLDNTQSAELRNHALTQAIRRHPRLSQRPQGNSGLESYMLERGRRNEDGESDESRLPRLLRPPSMINPGDRRYAISTAELRNSVEAYRHRYLQDPSNNGTDAGGRLDEVIKYLDEVRSCATDEEGMAMAMTSGILHIVGGQTLMSKLREDLAVNTKSIPPPPETSWLRVGSVFEGTQHAAGVPNTLRRRLSPTSMESGSESTPGATVPAGNPAFNIRHHPSDVHNCLAADVEGFDRFERWPVKVTIHSIDYNTMQLVGEMEAFDVPDRTAPESKSSITTYLEGEIIDLNNHSLETKNFRSSPRIDAIYWRKLLPFRGSDEFTMAQILLSKRWLTDHISKDWILMRWKEKCFITPSDQRLGLTISGFYYISLRRSDGFIEGLYYDPASTPYQHLTLRPMARTFPTYEFR
ncbi:MAG: hypothetical protein M1816_000184 [Peltula sp. TS41687]|nr:MAG: hypothetical protein M1816_000184 [Peltula sp. TS41687]